MDTAAMDMVGTAATAVGTAVGTPAMAAIAAMAGTLGTAAADIGAKTSNKTLVCFEAESHNKPKIRFCFGFINVGNACFRIHCLLIPNPSYLFLELNLSCLQCAFYFYELHVTLLYLVACRCV